MTILTSADFVVKPYVLPNQADMSEAYDLFIDEQVESLLKDLLGSPFYNALKTGIEALPDDWSATVTYVVDSLAVSGNKIYKSLQAANTNHAVTDAAWWVEEPANKWLTLKYGDDYTYPVTNGTDYTWIGLKKLLKPAVYCRYLTDFSSDSVGVGGIATPKVENGDMVSPGDKMAKAWNEYDTMASGGNSVYALSVDTFYGYLFVNGSDFDAEVTSKGYDTFEQYLSLAFKDPGNMNTFDF